MSGEGIGNAALIALLAIVPLVVLMLTSFVKLSVVLALLRNAIGSPDAPSGLVVMGLSLVLTFFVMAPVGVDMIRAASGTSTPGAPTPGAPTPTPTQGQPAPKPDAPKADAPKDVPKADAPKPDVPKPDVPKVDAPKPDVPKADVPKADAPKADAPKPDAPNPDAPRTDAPKGDAPKPAPKPGAPIDPYTPSGGATPGKATPAPLDPYPAGATPVGAPLDLDTALRQLVPAKYQQDVDAAARALRPLEGFLAKHADPRDRETFVGLAGRMGRASKGDELWVLAPAFLTTELREAFAIAVLIFVPFLVIDLVVGLALAALGLTTTQPQTITLPLKLLLFVAVDGWRLLIDSLLRGYV